MFVNIAESNVRQRKQSAQEREAHLISLFNKETDESQEQRDLRTQQIRLKH